MSLQVLLGVSAGVVVTCVASGAPGIGLVSGVPTTGLASGRAGVCSHCGARVARMVLMTQMPLFPEARKECLLDLGVNKRGMLT